ncbi:MAG TPA: 2-phospho-L-lactate guanylyltransferase [Dehalococcoidia bacterium]|nr:2-phospho-L-lactate guanylyltransferase [Dehalococcoidia bacterium]
MIAALVPVKRLAQAKSRLRPVLSDGQRREFVLAMLEDVLRLTLGQPAIEATAVVSADEDVLAFARRLGAQPIREPPGVRGLNAALAFAADALARQGATGLLVVPADVPLATPADIEAILTAWKETPVVLCPSHSGGLPTGQAGTGALALRPPQAIPFRFGPHSFAAHRRAAAERGLPVAVLSRPGLALDIDRPEDLRAVLAGRASRSREALRTAAVVAAV